MTKNWIICAAAALLAASSAFAQRATTEERAADYIRGAFLTQAAPGILDDHVTVAPELAKRLKLASGAGSSKVYEALAAMTDNKQLNVQRASPAETASYGEPSGFNPTHPLYKVRAGEVELYVQYDLRADTIPFVGLPSDARPRPAPAPMAKLDSRAAQAKSAETMKLVWTELFAYNKAALSPQGVAQLDGEILPKIAAAEIRHINVAGHTDTIGREKYNQKLSEKRAEAVRAYLVAKGVDASKIEAAGFGKTQPVKECKEKRRAAQIECLAPNRRVVVEIEALAKN